MDELVCRCSRCGVVEGGRAFGSGYFPICSAHPPDSLYASSVCLRVWFAPTCHLVCRFDALRKQRLARLGLSLNLVVCRHVHCAVTPQQRGGDAYHTGGLSAHRTTTNTEPNIGGWRRAASAIPRRTQASLGSCRLAPNDHQDSRCRLSRCLRLGVARAGSGRGQTRFHRATTDT